MSLILLGFMLIVGGIVVWILTHGAERKQRAREGVMLVKFENEKERELQSIRLFQAEHSNIIPAVPEGVSSLEFQGWFEEATRRLELWAIHHRSAADMALRIQLQKQINDLEEQWLRNQRTRSEIILVEHRHKAEIAKLERETAEAQDQTAQIRERAEQRKNPPSPAAAPKHESLGEKLARVDRECEEEVKKYPEQKEFLERARDDRKMKIMEGRE